MAHRKRYAEMVLAARAMTKRRRAALLARSWPRTSGVYAEWAQALRAADTQPMLDSADTMQHLGADWEDAAARRETPDGHE